MDQNKLRTLAGMQPLGESPANRRYLAVSGDGDGVDYKVFADPQNAYEHIENCSDYQEIIAFTGEILSIAGGSRGEIILNDDKNTEQIYHWEHGSVYVDKLGLSGEVVGD